MTAPTRSIPYDTAVQLLQRPGCALVKTFTNTKRGREFSITGKNGGPVTEAVAARLMAHPKCHPVDPGLLPIPGTEQTFSLHQTSKPHKKPPATGGPGSDAA